MKFNHARLDVGSKLNSFRATFLIPTMKTICIVCDNVEFYQSLRQCFCAQTISTTFQNYVVDTRSCLAEMDMFCHLLQIHQETDGSGISATALGEKRLHHADGRPGRAASRRTGAAAPVLPTDVAGRRVPADNVERLR